MALKKFCQVALLFASLSTLNPLYAQATYAGDTIQIDTAFQSLAAKATWLLILRDMNTGQVLPYMYDIRNNYNYWIALPMSHNYRVTVSTLTFGPYAVIHNFCHLEDGVISWHSLYISLKGNLTPDRHTTHCHIQRYKDMPFPLIGSY